MKKPVNSLSASVNQNQFWLEVRLDVSRKKFGSRSGPTHIGTYLDPNCLILKVCMHSIFESQMMNVRFPLILENQH